MAAAAVAEPSTLVVVMTGELAPRFTFHSRIERDDVAHLFRYSCDFPAPYVRYELPHQQWRDRRDAWLGRLGDQIGHASIIAKAFALREIVKQVTESGVSCRRFVITGEPADVGDDQIWQTFAAALAARLSLRPIDGGAARGHDIIAALHDKTRMSRFPSMSAAIKSMAAVEPRLIRPRLEQRRAFDRLFKQ